MVQILEKVRVLCYVLSCFYQSYSAPGNVPPRRSAPSAFVSGSGFQPKSEKERTLSTLFQPPFEIMTQTDFNEVQQPTFISLQSFTHYPFAGARFGPITKLLATCEYSTRIGVCMSCPKPRFLERWNSAMHHQMYFCFLATTWELFRGGKVQVSLQCKSESLLLCCKFPPFSFSFSGVNFSSYFHHRSADWSSGLVARRGPSDSF